MKLLIYLVISSFLVFGFGCKKDKPVTQKDSNDKWITDKNVLTFKLEYTSTKKLKKCSKFINDTLSEYFTIDYMDTTAIQKYFNKNSIQTHFRLYFIDTNKRTTKYHDLNADSSIYTKNNFTYSTSGFPNNETIDIIESNYNDIYYKINDNGNDITYEEGNLLYNYYTPSDTISKLEIPLDLFYQIIPTYIGVFGKVNKHLLRKYYQTSAGPSSIARSYRFEYTLDSEGKVLEFKKYKKEYPRDSTPPTNGIIQQIKYKYVFE